VAQALRVLKPGGLLIMETPNPENLVVATRNFYLDPTHQRPIPSPLLAFVAEHAGFARVKTLRLQESNELVNRGDIALQDVFAGASPDYAVVAQKYAPDEVLALTSDPFGVDYGLSLDDLVNRWDNRFDRLETKAQQAEIASNERFVELQAVYASTSWKVTRPLRAIKHLLAGDFAAFGRSTAAAKLQAKQTFRPILSSGIGYVFNRPALRKTLSVVLKNFPSLHRRLLSVAINTGVVGNGDAFQQDGSRAQGTLPLELNAMTPRARQIYQDLKASVENKHGRIA
jgi:O-antigen chain-terminating methyltransferase